VSSSYTRAKVPLLNPALEEGRDRYLGVRGGWGRATVYGGVNKCDAMGRSGALYLAVMGRCDCREEGTEEGTGLGRYIMPSPRVTVPSPAVAAAWYVFISPT
jgi:hypothetical protein